MYHYFVSYVSTTGLGCTGIARPAPIRDMNDIHQVLDDISRELRIQATAVISFQRFDN